jgi:hypothetical protein
MGMSSGGGRCLHDEVMSLSGKLKSERWVGDELLSKGGDKEVFDFCKKVENRMQEVLN